MPCEDESQECKQARSDYDSAHQDLLDAETDIANAKSIRNTGGGVAATGVGIAVAAALATNPVGWLIIGGAAVAALGVGYGGTGVAVLRRARQRCRTARKRMYDAFSRASRYCRDANCVPPRPTQSCA